MIIYIETYTKNDRQTWLDDVLKTKDNSEFYFKGNEWSDFYVIVSYLIKEKNVHGYTFKVTKIITGNEDPESTWVWVLYNKSDLRKELVVVLEKYGFKSKETEVLINDTEFRDIEFNDNEMFFSKYEHYYSKLANESAFYITKVPEDCLSSEMFDLIIEKESFPDELHLILEEFLKRERRFSDIEAIIMKRAILSIWTEKWSDFLKKNISKLLFLSKEEKSKLLLD